MCVSFCGVWFVGKTLFGKNDEKVILDRMSALNQYLETLLKVGVA